MELEELRKQNESQQPEENQEIDLEKYRPRLSQVKEAPAQIQVSKIIRYTIGLIMMAFYIGVGVILLGGFDLGIVAIEQYLYNIDSNGLEWVRWIIGAILVLYGIWRGYRQFKGLDYYSNYRGRE